MKYFINNKNSTYIMTVKTSTDDNTKYDILFNLVEVDVIAYYLYDWFRIRP